MPILDTLRNWPETQLPSSQLPSCLINHYSRYMLGLSGVPAVIMLIGLLFMPESPRWLVSKGKVEKAKKVLQRIRNSDDVDEEIYDITQTIQKQRLGKKLLVCWPSFRPFHTFTRQVDLPFPCLYIGRHQISYPARKWDYPDIWLSGQILFIYISGLVCSLFDIVQKVLMHVYNIFTWNDQRKAVSIVMLINFIDVWLWSSFLFFPVKIL